MMDGWGHGLLGVVWMVLFWGGIIALPVLVVWFAASRREGRKSTPREILEERYARGEIDAEEFERRKRELDRH